MFGQTNMIWLFQLHHWNHSGIDSLHFLNSEANIEDWPPIFPTLFPFCSSTQKRSPLNTLCILPITPKKICRFSHFMHKQKEIHNSLEGYGVLQYFSKEGLILNYLLLISRFAIAKCKSFAMSKTHKRINKQFASFLNGSSQDSQLEKE